MDPKERESLETQLRERRESIRLLKEEISKFIDPKDPQILQLEKNIRLHQRRVKEIEERLRVAAEAEAKPGRLIDERDFINRRLERQDLEDLNRPPFCQIYGPAGYGKRFMLMKLRDTYERRSWATGWLSFSDDAPARNSVWQAGAALLEELGGKPEGDLEHITAQLADLIASKGSNVVLFFDSVELAIPSVVEWIEDMLLSDLESTLRIDKVRAFFASRHPIKRKRPSLGHRFTFYRLSHFREADVGEMLNHFAKRDGVALPAEKSRVIVANLLRLTRGHPKCVKLLIDRLSPGYNPAIDSGRFVKERELFVELIKPVLYKEILSEAPQENMPAFRALSTFRRVTPDMISVLAEHLPGYDVSSPFSRQGFVNKFCDMGLVVRLEPGGILMYETDPVARHMFGLEQLFENENEYKKLHKLALRRVYMPRIEGKNEEGQPVSHPVAADWQVVYIPEALYHCCRLLQAEVQSETANLAELTDLLSVSLKQLRPAGEIPLADCIGAVRHAIETDMDLPPLISEVAGSNGYDVCTAMIDEFIREGQQDVVA